MRKQIKRTMGPRPHPSLRRWPPSPPLSGSGRVSRSEQHIFASWLVGRVCKAHLLGRNNSTSMHEPGEKGRGGRKGWELAGEEITKKGEGGERGGGGGGGRDERCLLRRRLMHRCKEEGVGSGKRKGENSNYLLFPPPSSSLSLTASLPNHVSPDYLDIVLFWIKRDGKQKGGEMIASKLVRTEWRATTLRLIRYLLGQSFLERREVQWVKTGTSGHPGQEK